MKMTYTDEELQKAIDDACEKACIDNSISSGLIYIDPNDKDWEVDSKARLTIAKTFLEALPKSASDIQLERIIAAAHEVEWNGTENSKDLAQFIKDNPEEVGNRQSALLAASTLIDELKGKVDHWFSNAKSENEKYLKALEKIGRLEKLQNDPHDELKKAHAEGKIIQYTDDSTWSGEWKDCRVPLWITGDDHRVNARYRIKPEDPTPSTVWDDFDKTAGVDFDGAAPWTPTIGDVVQLKSGGPKMTIHFLDTKNAGCVTFSKSSEFVFSTLPQACWIPVTTDNSSKVKS